jgi:hypothetical protein
MVHCDFLWRKNECVKHSSGYWREPTLMKKKTQRKEILLIALRYSKINLIGFRV